MSFFRFIEKIRNKSEQDRRAISLVGASVMFSLVFFVWLTIFQLETENVGNEEAYNELSPIASLKDMSSRFFTDIKEEFNFNKNDEPTESVLELQTETAATGAVMKNISDEETIGTTGTTTENIFFENDEENENLSGTSSDETEMGTSSIEGVDIDDMFEFVEDTAEDEEKTETEEGPS